MKIECTTAEEYMEKAFDGNIEMNELKDLEKHCKKCIICRVKYYIFKSTVLPNDKKLVEQALEANLELDKKQKRLKKILIISGIVLFIGLLIGLFIYLTATGNNNFFVTERYGVSETYTERTDEHPSYEDVKTAMALCRDSYPVIGQGTILLTLNYCDEYTFKKELGSEKSIVISFSYFRVFPTPTSKKTLSKVGDYCFVVKLNEDTNTWKVLGNRKLVAR